MSNDFHREDGVFEQVKLFLAPPYMTAPQNAWAGSATYLHIVTLLSARNNLHSLIPLSYEMVISIWLRISVRSICNNRTSSF